MTIEKAKDDDIGTLAGFQQMMAQETENLHLDDMILQQGIRALFDDPSKGVYYVARENGIAIGCLMITYEWSDWRNGTVLWIQSVYVIPEYRRKGVFRNLYEYIRDLVNVDPGLRGIRLYVEKDNKTAQQVYASLGMDGEHYQLFEWMK